MITKEELIGYLPSELEVQFNNQIWKVIGFGKSQMGADLTVTRDDGKSGHHPFILNCKPLLYQIGSILDTINGVCVADRITSEEFNMNIIVLSKRIYVDKNANVQLILEYQIEGIDIDYSHFIDLSPDKIKLKVSKILYKYLVDFQNLIVRGLAINKIIKK